MIFSLPVFLVVYLITHNSCLAEYSRGRRETSTGNAAPNTCETVTILHTNDVHARFEQFSKLTGRCTEDDAQKNKCYGGFPRMYTMAQEIRARKKNVIWLNGGDYFQGTVWYTNFKWKPFNEFVQWLNHTAIALGNHEFDDGPEGLIPFVSEISAPILAANMDASKVPNLQRYVNKSTIVEVGGCRIGIIGYITPRTVYISRPGANITFTDEVEAINAEVAVLKQQGVSFFIAVGHSGYEVDLQIAEKVPEIDVVVGGHSNTFLYTGPQPDREKPVDVYPKVVTQKSGKQVPVVQAYAYGKYLGDLTVKVNENGDVTEWSGNPILLNASIPQDVKMLEAMQSWIDNLDVERKKEVGKTRVLLSQNRKGESNLGNLITDSMVYMGVKHGTGPGWTTVPIAITNSGGIRAPIDETVANGTITIEDIFQVLPFQNAIKVIELQGQHIRQLMEYAVRGPAELQPGGFLQISGIKATYDLNEEEGHRLKKLLVRCGDCRTPVYRHIEDDKYYTVAVPNYLLTGGDGYNVIKNNAKLNEYINQDMLDTDVLIDYLSNQMPLIYQGVEGRIQIIPYNSNIASNFVSIAPLYAVILAILARMM